MTHPCIHNCTIDDMELNMKKVQVLLSAYNGEKYLEEQIRSILAQEHKQLTLLIRDDGSTDHTIDIIKRYADNYENVAYYTGKNLGVQQSFFNLMKHADKTADFYAFADQDDVWMPDKITRAIALLEKESTDLPLLYASETKLVDEHLAELPVKIRKYAVVPDFGNAVVENICTGCTEVFNRSLLEMVIPVVPRYAIMHDWWLYLCASCFGKVIYDPDPYMLYRQHANNKIGKNGTWRGELRTRLTNFGRSYGALRRQAREFRRVYGTTYARSQYIDWVADYKKKFDYRWKLVTSSEIHRQRWLDDVIFRGLFLLGMR